MILVATPEHIPLARDGTDGFLVYDENFELIGNLDADVRIDGIRGAVSVAEDKHRCPREQLVSLTDDRSIGPDPRDDPDYHLTDEELARKYPDPDDENVDSDDAHRQVQRSPVERSFLGKPLGQHGLAGSHVGPGCA